MVVDVYLNVYLNDVECLLDLEYINCQYKQCSLAKEIDIAGDNLKAEQAPFSSTHRNKER